MKFVTTLYLVFHICCQRFKRHFETYGKIIIFKNIITKNKKETLVHLSRATNNPSKSRRLVASVIAYSYNAKNQWVDF